MFNIIIENNIFSMFKKLSILSYNWYANINNNKFRLEGIISNGKSTCLLRGVKNSRKK